MTLVQWKNTLGALLLLEILVGSAFWVGSFNVSSMGHEQARAQACFANQRVLDGALIEARVDHPDSYQLQAGPFPLNLEEDLLREKYLKSSLLSQRPSTECRLYVGNGPSNPLFCVHHGAFALEMSQEISSAWIPPSQRPRKLFRSGDATGLLLALVFFLPLGFLYRKLYQKIPTLLTIRGFLFLTLLLGETRVVPFFVGLLFAGLSILAVLLLLWVAIGIMISGKIPDNPA